MKVYAGTDPLTGREIRFRKTCKTEQAAQVELGRLLAQAAAGRQPDLAAWNIRVKEALNGYPRSAGHEPHVRGVISSLEDSKAASMSASSTQR